MPLFALQLQEAIPKMLLAVSSGWQRSAGSEESTACFATGKGFRLAGLTEARRIPRLCKTKMSW